MEGSPHRERPGSITTAQAVGIILSLVACVLPGSGWAQRPTEPSCSSCHDQGEKLQRSAHASVGCASCHLHHEEYPHPAGIPKPACDRCHAKVVVEHAQSVHGQALRNGNTTAPDCEMCHGRVHELARATSAAFHKAVPDTCGMCHREIAEQFRASGHGRAVAKGITAAPVCTTCHGEHSILSPKNAGSPVHFTYIRETCGQCHGSVALNRRFSLPPDRPRSGSQTVANCASCHGIHNILASSDPRSTTNSRNLPATCGKCHPRAGARFALGTIHELQGRAEPRSVRQRAV